MQTFKTSKAKENILRKIRTGLKEASLPMPFAEVEKESLKNVFAVSDLSVEETFANAFIALGGKFVFCADEAELMESIQILYDQRGWTQLLCSDQKLLNHFQSNRLDFVQLAENAKDTADACITGCEMLVARTGSFIISSAQQQGRTATVYFPVHIVVAKISQLVYDLQDAVEALTKKYGTDFPSMVNLNTGPSRTADIEKTLVVGVHGPGEVFCFLVAD